jgi:nitrogen fixation/metabolism regulation signal transduction histidine kinase
LDEFRKLRADREEKELFLQTIVQHVGIGLLVFDQGGKVHLMNTACKRLLQVKALLHVKELSGPAESVVTPLLASQGGDAFLQKIQVNGELLQLSVAVGECLLRERRLRIASIQNIGNELNKKELEAWHMLTRVLSHEIMNSMTPIISLASSAAGLLEEQKTKTLSAEEVQDVVDAVTTIERRAGGLTRFVETYRSLTRIPRPVFKELSVTELFADAERWMKEKVGAEGIQFKVILPDANWRITADPALIEQVLLNVVLNAVDAVQEQHQKHIELRAVMDAQSRLLIQVEDNGKGILKDIQEEIFIPFFTTKRSGSGIGLSLSRQIMSLHGGTIQVVSEPGIKTVFTLKF